MEIRLVEMARGQRGQKELGQGADPRLLDLSHPSVFLKVSIGDLLLLLGVAQSKRCGVWKPSYHLG